jgi:feruloyl esterase
VNYDFKDYAEKTERLAAILNANNPDLSEFRKAGGKLLLYHGWSDAALSALGTIDYVESVYRLDASAKNDVRLFMMPGVLHCAGGPGPQQADFLSALEQWE